MRVFLAGVETYTHIVKPYLPQRPFLLSSFYYANQKLVDIIPQAGDFLLDSGAFTLFSSGGGGVDFRAYVERYADFINEHGIQKFFELDIDSVVGYDEVLKLRERLEYLTGKQCIPVWHTNRGQDEFIRMAKEYPYVAIGGLVGTGDKEYARQYWKYFPWFIKTAHDNGAKIHALGFTSIDGLKRYHFDSVDSTRWNCGRFGRVEYFTGDNIKVMDWRKKNLRLKKEEAEKMSTICFGEWVKFQKWAENHL